MKKLICNTVHYFKELDVWSDGCQLTGGSSGCYDQRMQVSNLEAAIDACMNIANTTDRSAVEVNACDEPGRIDVAVTENAEGYQLNASETEQWKAGDIEAFYAVYSFYWFECKPAEF